ncbi:MAG: proline--tRNA ligase [Proteobacteria bacterium]|nr:proline--tRNA ligase [Pseudomonadota bacterium]
MKAKDFHLETVKESPAEAEIPSHKLLIRAGMIRKMGSGIYVFSPLGMRVLQKIISVVRKNMEGIGALELLTPMVQPADYWKKTNRWESMGQELLRLKDRHGRDFVLQPTSEEIFVEIAKVELKSWRKLPKVLFQIQTKFRDERRPRFGLLRAREFLMKDAYSFDIDEKSAHETYEKVFSAYQTIFTTLGLKFATVLADSGNIGGTKSHEFHVISETGEDELGFCVESDFAANIELIPIKEKNVVSKRLEKMTPQSLKDTPDVRTCEEVAKFFEINIENVLKSILIVGQSKGVDKYVMLLLRGDRRLNELKVDKLKIFQTGWRFASVEEVRNCLGVEPGFIGPQLSNEEVQVIADFEVLGMQNFIIGANKDNKHFTGTNWDRDIEIPSKKADLRFAVEGDSSPDNKGKLLIKRGIEVGHTFFLGTKYSKKMDAFFSDENGKMLPFEMGCYGIGVSRIMAAAVEQNNDSYGIIWPSKIAPFSIVLCPIQYYLNSDVRTVTEDLYLKLKKNLFDVVLDDRNERVGIMLADWELVGVPVRVLISPRLVKQNEVEVLHRREMSQNLVDINGLIPYLKNHL